MMTIQNAYPIDPKAPGSRLSDMTKIAIHLGL